MKAKSLFFATMFCSLALMLSVSCPARDKSSEPSASAIYETRANHDPDGIGKFYHGREIAQVMGHQAADWLERPKRETEEQPALLVKALNLKPGDAVADIGAGTGYYSRRLAQKVGPGGIVYAEEIQPEMLVILTNRMEHFGIHNVRPVLGTITDPKLAADSVDLILMVDVYHEFDHPHEMVAAMLRSLKHGGRMVFVEYRGEDPQVPIKPLHKMTVAQVRKEMADFPIKWVQTIETLPMQHVIIFQK
jgi:SAM-dependent methyltransferase